MDPLTGVASVLEPGAVGVPFDPVALFGRPCPLEVEIGVGKGKFLLAWAAARPEVGFLGVERARVYLGLTASRAERAGLDNVRLIQTTGEDLLFRCLRPGSVAAVHVYFPDPWPKKRHHKRRFLSAANVGRIAEVLAPCGVLRLKTDHAGYAEVIGAVLDAETRLEPADAEEVFAGLPPTNFEIKYAREARQVFRFARVRRGV